MKILFIGVYREQSGWGEAAINYVRALVAAGLDVVVRPFVFDNRNKDIPPDILALEAKSAANCDVLIQNTLPHHFEYCGGMRNIGLYYSETSSFIDTQWPTFINSLDEAWVPNQQAVDASIQSGVTVPIKQIPFAFDIEKYSRSYEPLKVLAPYVADNQFIFYYIGELGRRKNLEALIKAFHLEFDPSEPVQLVLKCGYSHTSMNAQSARERVRLRCKQLREELKLHRDLDAYKAEIIITETLTNLGVCKLHQAGSCFVMPSYGEAWCIPAFEAMAMGRTPIVPKSTGFLDYMSDSEGWMVDVREEPACDPECLFPDLYTGNENWYSVDINHLRKCMRHAFSANSIRKEKAANGIDKSFDFTYARVGQIMRQALE